MQDADTSTDRLITRTKSTGSGTSGPDDRKFKPFISDDSEIEPVLKKRNEVAFDSIMLDLKLMEENQTTQPKVILKTFDSNTVSISEVKNVFHIEDETQGVKVKMFLYNLQQPTKKIDAQIYSKILINLIYQPTCFSILVQKMFSMSFTEKKKNNRLENKKTAASTAKITKSEIRKKDKTKIRWQQQKRQTKTRIEKTGFSIDDVKNLDNLYLKGPASFGNAKDCKIWVIYQWKSQNVSGNETILHQISFT